MIRRFIIQLPLKETLRGKLLVQLNFWNSMK